MFKDTLIGLTQYYRLYIDSVEVANNCNSFYVHDEFMLFTDHSNTLKFVNLSNISKNYNQNITETKIFTW